MTQLTIIQAKYDNQGKEEHKWSPLECKRIGMEHNYEYFHTHICFHLASDLHTGL